MFKIGVIVGLLLLATGVASSTFSLMSYTVELLVLCTGAGIILGAFGSTANIRIPEGFVLSGVAGITAALLILIENYLNESYLKIKISGDVDGSQIELVGDHSYLGAYQDQSRSYDFVIFGNQIQRAKLSLYMTMQNQSELIFDCINKKVLKPHLGSGTMIEWQLDESNSILVDALSNDVVATVGGCTANRQVILFDNNKPTHSDYLLSFISDAYASDVKFTIDDLRNLTPKLESNVNYVRRDARSQIASIGIGITRPMLDILGQEPVSYREKLGALVALVEMMRENKENRLNIIRDITDQDLARLLDASIHKDRTIRVYASEFLFDLGDPRVVSPALERLDFANANGRYNLVLVVKGATPYLNNEDRIRAYNRLAALRNEGTPKTNELIDSIASMLPES